MKLVITIDCENKAFDGADSGNELARILRPLPDLFEFESKSTIARRGIGANPKRLRSTNGNTVGHVRTFPFTRRSLMTQPELDARRYLQNAGRRCPVCHLEVVWHEHNQDQHSRREQRAASRSALLVQCVFRDLGRDLPPRGRSLRTAQEADATAKKTYKGGP